MRQRGLGKLSLESGPGIVTPCGGSRGTDYFRVKTNLARRGATRGSREAEPSRADPSRGSRLECKLTSAHDDDEGGVGARRHSRGEANGICAAIFRGLISKRPCSRLWQHSVRSGHPGWQDSKPRGSQPGTLSTIGRRERNNFPVRRNQVLNQENLPGYEGVQR